jgi:hypothetical protein
MADNNLPGLGAAKDRLAAFTETMKYLQRRLPEELWDAIVEALQDDESEVGARDLEGIKNAAGQRAGRMGGGLAKDAALTAVFPDAMRLRTGARAAVDKPDETDAAFPHANRLNRKPW